LSPFIVGVTIVALGTSFPELVSSIVAVLKGATEIVVANAAGSNIANILLVVGVAALVGRRLVMTKSLIDIDLPLLAISTAIFLGMAWDGEITFVEAIILLATYVIYLLYIVFHKPDEEDHALKNKKPTFLRPKLTWKEPVFLCLGIAGLIFGAKYLIDSVIELSEILNIGTGVIALVAVAFGTSLPELIVSVKAAMQGKSEVALGNILGSNVFNILVVVGVPGLFKSLKLDEQTFAIGLPVLIVATFLFILSGISKRFYLWEGAMYLVVYIFFIGKLFNLI
ncbi:calcium/sodium antiporter, partial [Patescibacteria group bacterium]